METPSRTAILGCLLGTAVGDAMGLPYEGLSPRRLRRLYSAIDSHRFCFRRGMTSDDTEHACLVADALIASAGEERLFECELAHGLRRWILSLPASVGLATLRACVLLCVGVPARRSGVFSAGNGPAMRSALLGVCYGPDSERMRTLVGLSNRITHTDPKAEHAAVAVALAGHLSSRGDADPAGYGDALRRLLGDRSSDFAAAARSVVDSVRAGASTPEFALRLGLRDGVSGYCLHSVPVALHAWLRYPVDYRSAVLDVIACGGDTDTMAAITGAIVGARVGVKGIPAAWLDGWVDWPRNRRWIEARGALLLRMLESGGRSRPPQPLFAPLVLRNGVFAAIAIAHGLRRLLPPYTL
jgi:ADP-ribosylglycohydrolase